MGRPPGSRNADYEQKRRALTQRVVASLVKTPAEHASLRELARIAGVSVSTMRHYFGDREGIVAAAIETMGGSATRRIDAVLTRSDVDIRQRVEDLLRALRDAWTRDGVGRAHAVGMAEGFYGNNGPTYVRHLLEPFVQAIEQALTGAWTAGDAVSQRHAALALVAPIWLALTHQESLGGEAVRPMDMDALISEHVDHFLRGWSAVA